MKKLRKLINRWTKRLLLITIPFLTGAVLGYTSHHDIRVTLHTTGDTR